MPIGPDYRPWGEGASVPRQHRVARLKRLDRTRPCRRFHQRPANVTVVRFVDDDQAEVAGRERPGEPGRTREGLDGREHHVSADLVPLRLDDADLESRGDLVELAGRLGEQLIALPPQVQAIGGGNGRNMVDYFNVDVGDRHTTLDSQ